MNANGPAGDRDDANPDLRATDDERRMVADELAAALGRGQLELGEFEQRTEAVWAGRTRGEIVDPLKDLVPNPLDVIGGADPRGTREIAQRPHPAPPAPRAANRPAERDTSARDVSAVAKAHVTGETGGSVITAAVMFGSEQNGEWLCPSTHYAVAIMGGVEVDLRNARFESPATEIVAVAIMGGINVIVPEDMRLSVQGTGLMGGFGSSKSKEVVLAGHDLPPDAPHVRVTGVALMGGVEVVRETRYGED